MKTGGPAVCLASSSLYDPELLAMYALLLAVLASGGIVIYATYRWYHTLQNAPSTRNDDLAQLAHALDHEDDLKPEEREQIRATLERQQQPGAPENVDKTGLRDPAEQ